MRGPYGLIPGSVSPGPLVFNDGAWLAGVPTAGDSTGSFGPITGSVAIEGGHVDSYEGRVETVAGSAAIEGGHD